jgi:hypothetical protein
MLERHKETTLAKPPTAILLALLPLLFPPPARAALTPVGAPLAIADETRCSSIIDLEVIATPKGAFEVVWVDGFNEVVKGRRFARNLQAGPPQTLLFRHGGLDFFDFEGAWAGRYELVMNVLDFGDEPADPTAAYRVQLDLEGDPLAAPARVKPPRFLELAPAAGGDSLQFRFEPPIFGPVPCLSWGLLARRIDRVGNPLSPESRVNHRASARSIGGPLEVTRLPDDTFVAAYGTCHKFIGVVVRRLDAAGAPVGKPINLPLPGQTNHLALAARGADIAVVAAGSLWVVADGQVLAPTLISSPLGVSGVFDLAASPAGRYLLLFQGFGINPERRTLFAQEFDARGGRLGAPLAITGDNEFGVEGGVASLPNGRWIVVTRVQSGAGDACRERLVGTVLDGG